MENLRILLGEILVELFDFIQQDLKLVSRRQDGHSGRRQSREDVMQVDAIAGMFDSERK